MGLAPSHLSSAQHIHDVIAQLQTTSLQLPIDVETCKRHVAAIYERLHPALPALISRCCSADALQEQTARRRAHKGGCTHEEPGRDERWLIFSTQPAASRQSFGRVFSVLGWRPGCDAVRPVEKARVTTEPTLP